MHKNIITTFPTSDDSIDIKKIGYVISKDEKEMVKQVKEILKEKSKKTEVNLDEIQENRMHRFEEMFDA